MNAQAADRKWMTLGEGGTAFAMVLLACLSIIVAANAYTAEYAFHAYLFSGASIAAVMAIVSRYYERPAGRVPLDIDGKPNYNMGPVKFAALISMFWGIAGFLVGVWAALELAFPVLNFDLPWITFGRSETTAHLGSDICIRRQRSDCNIVLCRPANVSCAARRRYSALVCRAWLQFFYRHRRHRLSARHHTIKGICRTRVVRRSVADGGLGRLSAGVSRHDHAAPRTTHLCGQLVLPRVHRDHRGSSPRQ